MNEPQPWHRLFGLSLVDFFRGMPVTVELEKDLSLKQQLLDVAIIVNKDDAIRCRVPDGFNNLSKQNLVTFKSFRQALDGWALDELVSYYVNYRKQVSPSMKNLLPFADFKLYAVCVRYPLSLAREVTLSPIQPGVYEVGHFTGTIRVIVIQELPKEEHNALLHLFSAHMDQVRYGALNDQHKSTETSSLLLQLFQRYNLEVTNMPTGLEELKQFAEETIEELLKELPPERLVKLLTPEQLLKALSPKEREELARLLIEDGSTTAPPGNAKDDMDK
jgi:hypothetical protein